ncbi:hypothetical protein BDW72DRAFT_199008 [Aspergillus terricola var. indicus]
MIVAEEPESESPPWIQAKRLLETYFFRFPERLLRFSSAQYAYQLEAMVWMHGLFIVLCKMLAVALLFPWYQQHLDSTKDLVDLLKNGVYLRVPRFSPLLDHSLLIGEVLPVLLTLDPYMESISPGTIYFMFLSSIVQCLALHQFSSDPSQQPPRKLIESSSVHLKLVDSVEAYCRRCDLLFVREIQRLLSTTISAATQGFYTGPRVSCHVLYLYRWTPCGLGIIQLKEQDALQAWTFEDKPTDPVWYSTLGMEATALRSAICGLCDEGRRICEQGFLDLSISVPI